MIEYDLQDNNKMFSFSPNPTWKLLDRKIDGYSFKNKSGLAVIISISIELDGKVWVHVSFSRASRMPDYKDMVIVKKNFIGDENKAIMVLPEKKGHVNIFKYCLHLFHCLEDDPLPDFTQGSGEL